MLENLYTIIELDLKYIFIKPSKEKKLDDFIDYSIPIVLQQLKIQEYINYLHNLEYIVILNEYYKLFKKRVNVIKNELDVNTTRNYINTLKLIIDDIDNKELNLISGCRKIGLLLIIDPEYQKVLSFLLYKTIVDTIKYILTRFHPYKTFLRETIIGNTGLEYTIPDVQFDLTQLTIVADTRRLRELWNQELVDDIEVYCDPQAEEEITNQLGEVIAAEVDREIVNELRRGSWYAPAGRNIDGGQAVTNHQLREPTTRTLNNIENEEQFEEYMNRHGQGTRLYPFRTYQEWQLWLNAPQTPINIELLTPRRRVLQAYARNQIREDFYGTIQVPNDEAVLQQHRTIEVYPERPVELIRVDFNIFDQQLQESNQIELTLRYDEAVLRDLEEHYIVDPIDAGLHPIDNIDTEIA